MRKIIDFHCHIYPDVIAERAVEGIKEFYHIDGMTLDGTVSCLRDQCRRNNVVHCVVQSVATTPLQVRSINNFISDTVKGDPGLFTGFGTLHQDSEDLEGDIEHILSLGLKGIKLHPDFQGFSLDSEEADRVFGAIAGTGLPVLVHCGDPRYQRSNPVQTAAMLARHPDVTVIGAHLGGWKKWDEAVQMLSGFDNFLVDSSSSFYLMDREQSLCILRGFGIGRVLFGTDYPMWNIESETGYIDGLGLTEEELDRLYYRNAAELLRREDI